MFVTKPDDLSAVLEKHIECMHTHTHTKNNNNNNGEFKVLRSSIWGRFGEGNCSYHPSGVSAQG